VIDPARAAELVSVNGLRFPYDDGPWTFDDVDAIVYALLTDPVYMPELLWRDQGNRAYGGCYRVRDYQYVLNRIEDNYAIVACARSVGKTESEKVHAQIHFWRSYENMLITAPELIHLLPLTDAIEENIRDSKLLMEMLDTRGGQTGFTHRPFGVNFIDGTKIVGRIPKLTGTGVKGQHQPFLIVEEGQDYPEKGWTEVNETVNYDAVDEKGHPAFRFWVFGVHSGNKASGFDEKARSSVYRKVQITALRRPDWNKDRKANAVAAYGGSSSPDYRRNILGEPGAGASSYFVTARVMACVDQRVGRGEVKGSRFNEEIYVKQTFRFEEVEALGMRIADLLDLPDGYDKVWAGVDLGLTESPTMISIFADGEFERRNRRALIRRFTLERFRTKQIREALYAIGWHFGTALQGVGIDITGLGFPIFQEMEDDELAPPHLLNVTQGYMFNSKIPVGVSKDLITEQNGVMKDHMGNLVKEEEDPVTGEKRYIVMMPFIGASTRFVREDVDSGYLLLPFDVDVTSDMLQETKQRVERLGKAQSLSPKKGDRFHILDSFRAMAMRTRSDEIQAAIAKPKQQPVLDMA
jgi:hypothetical protein